MIHARTISAIVTAAITLVLAPQISTVVASASTRDPVVAVVAIAPIASLPAIDPTDLIDGVRIVTDTPGFADAVEIAVGKFADAGWPLTNTEVRFDPDACDNAAGFHAEEKGHHLVVLCTDADWTLLHELGHVWSASYLDDAERAEWLAYRGLDSWVVGTEHAADIIAFGLYDTLHVPTSIGATDYRGVADAFGWLFGGVEPLYRHRNEHVTRSLADTTRFQVVAPTVVVPSDAVANESASLDAGIGESPASEFEFPMACGYPRWNSRNGGYGYVDPRDWTHNGVDLYAYRGTPVVSPVHGTVLDASWGDISGWKVVVEDRFGYVHVLEHLDRPPLVTSGMAVTAGQTIGEVGRTGNAAGGGPHLHYEIRLEGLPVDPMPWLVRAGGPHVEPVPTGFGVTEAAPWSACTAKA